MSHSGKNEPNQRKLERKRERERERGWEEPQEERKKERVEKTKRAMQHKEKKRKYEKL